ncbi:MAG: DUF1289 domain-containing protein [Hyphomicrobiales bacterium]|nr:DUF1289 domain-containing protein [Hyphomicrobiales bacterium]
MTQHITDIPSPCTGVCELDPDNGLCLGCLRDKDEIKAWRTLTDPEKFALLGVLRDRRRKLRGRGRERRRAAQTAAPPPPAADNPFGDCPSCAGAGSLTAQRSGDWRRDPDNFRPDQIVPCRTCGGTGILPRPGTFEEA